MSYIQPEYLIKNMINAGEMKVKLSTKDILIRAYMAGAILSLAAIFAITVTVNTNNPLMGAMLFPVGFIMIYLMKFDLLTGVFTLTSLALLDKRPGVTVKNTLRSWGYTFLGNFAGALTVSVMISFVLTFGYTVHGGSITEQVIKIGETRTLGYKESGLSGWFTIFIRGIFCNWMVSMGVIGAMISSSAGSKMMAMWMPIMLFFYMGFEHSIVNMFLFPFSMILGADFTLLDYFIWNEFPTILGNLIGGVLFVALPLYYTYR